MRVERTRYEAQRGVNMYDYAELVNNRVEGPVFFERRSGLMEVAYPAFLGQAEIELRPDSDRRSGLARLMVVGERPLVRRRW